MSEFTTNLGTALGFIAGEGSFSITKTKTSDDRRYVGFRFTLQVHERDRDIVEEMRDFFDAGNVRTQSRGDHNHVAWDIYSKDDLRKFRNTIEECDCKMWKVSEKYENYQVWSEALDIHLDGQTTADQQVEIAEIAKDLNKDFGGGWDEFIEEKS